VNVEFLEFNADLECYPECLVEVMIGAVPKSVQPCKALRSFAQSATLVVEVKSTILF
jgi:hypothetical protein